MAMRVFEFLKEFDYSEKQWFSPSATYQVVQLELGFLMGEGHPTLMIHGLNLMISTKGTLSPI